LTHKTAKIPPVTRRARDIIHRSTAHNVAARIFAALYVSIMGLTRCYFWDTVCKTLRPMLSDRCLSVLSCLSVCPVCDVGVLWPNGMMDQDESWHAGKPQQCRQWPHWFRWVPSSTSPKGAQPPIFGPYLLWPNGWMD